MRILILGKLREMFDEGYLTNAFDDTVKDFAAEIESLPDADLLEVYEYNIGFQG